MTTVASRLTALTCPDVELGMFRMFGQTGAPQKGGHHRAENVGQQRDIFWPVGAPVA